VGVTITDDDTGSASASTNVTVKNVAPSNGALTLTQPTPNEHGNTTLFAAFDDAGTQGAHTVGITWGPGGGSNPLNLAAGVLTFSASHQYLDDNPTGTSSDVYSVGVTITDDDTGSATASTSVTVNNVAPVVGSISGPNPSPGVRGQTLSFSDT